MGWVGLTTSGSELAGGERRTRAKCSANILFFNWYSVQFGTMVGSKGWVLLAGVIRFLGTRVPWQKVPINNEGDQRKE